ncbi:MAG: hypothetical protein ACYTCU_07145 [Planctomycetota bacterium]
MNAAQDAVAASSDAGSGADVAKGPARSGRLMGLALLWLVLGLGLRAVLAWARTGGVAEWEADGFVLGWEGRAWDSWNRMRPPLHPWILHGGVEAFGLQSILQVRLLCVTVSLLGLLAAWDLVLALAHWSRAPARRVGLALCWLTGCWALFPTLIVSAVSPTPEVFIGGSLCLFLSAVLRFRARPGPVRWAWMLATCALALGVGGLLVAVAVALALVVYLVPVPRLGVSLPLLLAAALAAASIWFVQRGPDASRPWLPDASPAYALASLSGVPLELDDTEPVDPDRRVRDVWSQVSSELASQRGLDMASAVTNRLLVDHLSPRRFEGISALPVLPLGLLDVFLRGGLILFASATLALSRRSQDSAAPRAAAVVGLVTLGWAVVVAGVGPFGMATFDWLILAVGAGGLAGADPARPAPRWIAFTIGGLMMSALGLWAMGSGRTPSTWTRELTHMRSQGSVLVDALADGGPRTAIGHVTAAHLMMDPAAPFQRLPAAAHRHATAALQLEPTSDVALRMVVEAEVENMRLVNAEELARTLVESDGLPTFENKVLIEWVQHKRRQWRSEGGE